MNPRTAVLAALIFASTSVAGAETVINSLPFTITAPGTYVLNSNLASSAVSGAAILINASNVVLDLRGHKLAGVHDPAGRAHAVYANNRTNITIKNGTVEGFYRALYLLAASTTDGRTNAGTVIENLRFDRCLKKAIYLRNAKTSRIEHCQVGVADAASNGSDVVAFDVTGAVLIRDNFITVTHVGAPVRGAGIYADGYSVVVGNYIENAFLGLAESSEVKYQDNLTANVTVPFGGGPNGGPGVDAGGNH